MEWKTYTLPHTCSFTLPVSTKAGVIEVHFECPNTVREEWVKGVLLHVRNGVDNFMEVVNSAKPAKEE